MGTLVSNNRSPPPTDHVEADPEEAAGQDGKESLTYFASSQRCLCQGWPCVLRRAQLSCLPLPPPPQCDQVMEFSWSALWNITDETPDNCEMFLSFNGMKLFLDCLKVGARLPPPHRKPLHRLHPMQTSHGHTWHENLRATHTHSVCR